MHNKKFKRSAAILLAILLTAVLWACSPDPTQTQPPTDPPPTLPQSLYNSHDFALKGPYLSCLTTNTIIAG